jgi:8-oxo-dGTP pyrophosphatase MutT (NUDIX family)
LDKHVIYTKEVIRQALWIPDFDVSAAQALMMPIPRGARPPEMPGHPRQGAVLAIAYAKNGQAHLVLTRRRDDLNDHAGQISFPGGQQEGNETMPMAALREAREEIGVQESALELLGELSTIYISPTDFEVHPYVAWHEGTPHFVPQDGEVAEILEASLSHLLHPDTIRHEIWEMRGYSVEVPFYLVDHHKVWGATAIMLSELIERIRAVL